MDPKRLRRLVRLPTKTLLEICTWFTSFLRTAAIPVESNIQSRRVVIHGFRAAVEKVIKVLLSSSFPEPGKYAQARSRYIAHRARLPTTNPRLRRWNGFC